MCVCFPVAGSFTALGIIQLSVHQLKEVTDGQSAQSPQPLSLYMFQTVNANVFSFKTNVKSIAIL